VRSVFLELNHNLVESLRFPQALTGLRPESDAREQAKKEVKAVKKLLVTACFFADLRTRKAK
jgi:hypothetical protein